MISTDLQHTLARLAPCRTLRGSDGRYYYDIPGVTYPHSIIHHHAAPPIDLCLGRTTHDPDTHITVREIASLTGEALHTIRARLDALEYPYHVEDIAALHPPRLYNRADIITHLTTDKTV